MNLLEGGDREPAYRALNPQGLVPALADDSRLLTQSLAICEYLEETHPQPPLLPADPAGRARVRALDRPSPTGPARVSRPVERSAWSGSSAGRARH